MTTFDEQAARARLLLYENMDRRGVPPEMPEIDPFGEEYSGLDDVPWESEGDGDVTVWAGGPIKDKP